MIEIKNISKNFKNNQALKNVSFSVNNGEIIGLLGENGAGKSTLLRIISTILLPSEGSAEINGYDILKSPKEVRKNIGILFGGESGLYERLTARENLEFFAKLNGMSNKESGERIKYLINKFSFAGYADKRVNTFSKGMKQKVAISRAIVHNPSVMLLDEPDSGLDFKASKTIFDFMEECKKEGKTIIFSSHSMENIKNYSDRTIVLHKGEIIKVFKISQYREKYSEKEINNMLFNLVCDGDENV
ncbi:MAG: ATP-binding cassette domain-containing protein [Clostridia bacterium]|nr:ATP-binding cassette domain-containing protein [Clostridia bacterium]